MYKHARQSFYPDTATIVRDKQSTAVAAVYERNEVPYAAMFAGKRNKPDRHYRYRSVEARSKSIAEYFENIRASEAATIERKAARLSKPRGLEVGDVLCCSWGYDQTNIDYYEVTALIGSRMVEIREIGCESVETCYMQGNSVPVRGSFIGEPMRKIAKDGAVSITSYSWAYKMDPVMIAGAPVYQSSHWTAYA